MDIRQVLQAATQDPRLQPALQAAQQELSDASPEQIDQLIRMVELALQRPDKYPEIRAAAIADDMMDEEDLPERFDGQVLAALLVLLYKLREGGGEQMAMARGGLSRVRTLARQGRLGDTMLAHISPEEAAMLKARGGAGTINPNTGLPQYFSLKKFLKAALPIALTFIAPGLGTAIGSAILGAGASAAATAALGGAVLGGLSAGLTGGNVLQGALLGGLGGGLGGYVGGAANSALGLGLGQTGQAILGGALVGGVGGAATGQGFGRGALTGALGAGVGEFAGQLGGELGGRLGSSVAAGGQQFGQALTAGYDPKTAAGMGAVSGLATAATYRPAGMKPSEAVVAEMREVAGPDGKPSGSIKLTNEFRPGESAISPEGGTYMPAGQVGATRAEPGFMERVFGKPATAEAGTGLQEPPTGSSGINLKTVGQLALASSLAQAASARPPDVQQAIQTLNPAQQEYFNRPSVQWDWQRMQNDANSQRMSLSEFMASFWPQITSGVYNVQVASPGGVAQPGGVAPTPGGVGMPGGVTPPPGLYRGGAYAMGGGPLGAVARLARGSGSGRADTINARLSDGEYVMDAETVAMLGDGSTDEGARRLDAMRAQLRKHKGKTLARGKFSPNAKSPLAYLKGAA